MWLGFALLLVVGVFVFQNFGGSRQAHLRPVRIALAAMPYNALVFFAAADGHFVRHGLYVELSKFQSGRVALNALAEKKADLAIAFQTPLALAALSGADVHVLTEIHSSSSNVRFVHGKKTSFEDLKSQATKRIGVTKGASTDFMLELFMASNEIGTGEIETINLEPDLIAPALRDGTIDAAMMWEPSATDFVEAHSADFTGLPVDFYNEISALVTRAEMIEQNPAILRSVIAALADAVKAARERPQDAFRAAVRHSEAGESTGWTRVWPRLNLHLGLSTTLVTMIGEEAAWHARQNPDFREQVREDYSHLIEPRFLLEIHPELVTYK